MNVTDSQQTIQSELIKCGKTAFIADSNIIETEMNFLSVKYPWHKFYKGKDVLEMSMIGVVFRYTGLSKVPRSYKSLVETGIHGRVEQELIERDSLLRKSTSNGENIRRIDVEERLGLGGMLSTFFIVWGVSIGVTLPPFVFEVRHVIWYGMRCALYSMYFKVVKMHRKVIRLDKAKVQNVLPVEDSFCRQIFTYLP